MPTVKCTFCGTPVYRHPCRLKTHKHIFCSQSCKGSYQKPVLRIPVACTQCGRLTSKRPSQLKANKNTFCSNACHYAYRHSFLRPVSCTQCGKVMNRIPYRINKCKKYFCSNACRCAHRTGSISRDGYRVIGVNNKVVQEHRFLMEQHLGRKLLPGEVVHHINGDKLDNALSNLVVMEVSAHRREHMPLTWDFEAAKQMRAQGMSFSKIGKVLGVYYGLIWSAFVRRGLHTPTPRAESNEAK